MVRLPNFLEEFLCLGEAKITEEIKPNWLIEPFKSPIWHIKIPGRSRFVDGKWLGTKKVDWRLQIPGGHLANGNWDILLQHCKLMVLAHIEGPNGKGSDPRALTVFQRKIVALAEHLIVHYPDETALFGLSSLSLEKIERYLADHLKGGIAGTGCWYLRWERYMLSKIKNLTVQNDINKQIKEQPDQVIKNIDNIHRNILTDDPPETRSMPKTKFSSEELKLARKWLLINNWYNQNGCIDLERLAKKIEVDPRRIANSANLKYYLRPLELCNDYRQEELQWSRRECLGHRYKSITQKSLDNASPADQMNTYKLIENLRSYSEHIDVLKNSVLSTLDLTNIPRNLKGGNSKRTPTLPVSTALYIYEHLIHWGQKYSKELINYYVKLLDYVIGKQGNAIRHYRKKYDNGDRTKIYPCIWEQALLKIPPPVVLNNLHLWRITPIATRKTECVRIKAENGRSKIPSILRNRGLPLINAMQLNAAVLVALVAVFSLRRINEIITLQRDCLVKKSGRCYLGFNMEKVGCDGIRSLAYRPIPNFLYNILRKQKQLANILIRNEQQNKNDPLLHNSLFIIPANTGGKIIDEIELTKYLDLFCDWIEVPLNTHKRRWYLRIHECRRFGAMSFFHLSNMEFSLPTLSWFMGHSDIKQTWRYIKEELSGQELTQCEVAMAHAALLNQQSIDDPDGKQKLQNFVLKHFGVTRLDLIDPDELDEYLEILHKEGIYQVIPHTIQLGKEKRYTILIEVNKDI